MKAREELAYKFYESILKSDEYPESVLDDENGKDVCFALREKIGIDQSEKYIIDKIFKIYGVNVSEEWLCIDFWQILDSLEQEQIRQKNQKFLPKS
jgi:hypothetical protein